MTKKLFLVSLGCSKNLVDSENIVGNLHEKGYSLTFEDTDADVFMINTCGFIGPARDEGYEVIEEALAWKEENKGIVAVVGCLAQRETDVINDRYPEVDVVSGFGGYDKLDESLAQALGDSTSSNAILTTDINHYEVPEAKTPLRLTGGASAYMKLGEGCSKRCAFCAIPHIRGNQRSVPAKQLASRAEALAVQGVREVILIAQDPVTYGKDLNDGSDLFTALDALEDVEGIDWVRLHYLYPGGMAKKVVERMAAANTKLLPYIDMPVQHACPDVLRGMNRPALGRTQDILAQARETIADVTIRTTFLTGFPGETEKSFKACLEFIEGVKFDRVGTFTYSPEKGTTAYDMANSVDPSVAVKRRDAIMGLAQDISRELNQNIVGTTQQVIIDIPPQGDTPAIGRTWGQSPEVDGVTFVEGDDIHIGDILEAEIVGFNEYDLFARF